MKLIGVDLGIRKINAAVFVPGASGFTLYDVPKYSSDNDTRGGQLWEVSRWLFDLAEFHQADSVWIEDIVIGNNRRYSISLAEAMGACLAVLTLRETVMSIGRVNNMAWKKELIGNGHASKDDVKNYIVETHPVYAALCEDDQDAYDATCIGLYGLTILDRAEHLTL